MSVAPPSKPPAGIATGQGQTELVTVVVGGSRFTSWLNVNIRAAVKEAARSFTLEVVAESGAAAQSWTFKAGAKVQIYANSDLLLTGYVDRFAPQMDRSRATATITGRSKGADAIDSSAIHETGRFEKKTPDAIAKELDKFGIGFKATEGMEAVDYQITPGESVFNVVERLSREQGFTLMGKADGSIEITKAGEKRHKGMLLEGVNILVGRADHNWSNRHSEYRVRGQKSKGSTAEDLEIEAVAKDAGVDRFRPVLIVEKRDTDKGRAKKRAKNRRDRSAGAGLTATITVQGWRDDAGEIWDPNKLVFVQSTFLNITQDMLVVGVTFRQDGTGGTITDLELADPKTYGGKGGKGVQKSGAAWKQDDSEAE